MSCYLITVDAFPRLVWFALARSAGEALDKIQPLALRIGLLSRSLRVQDFCSGNLEELITSKAWKGLNASDKIRAMIAKMQDLTKSMQRTADSLEIEVFIRSIENGLT